MFQSRSPTALAPQPLNMPPLSVMYVLAAFPVLSETFVSNEIRAMRRLGHRVVPLALAPHDGPCQPQDEEFRAETLALGDIAALPALAAVANPSRLRSALQFALRQTGLRPRSLMLAGARVAQAARQHGCTHLHAHFALPAAATAIVAARLAGLTSSFMAHGYDVYGTPADLELKLRHADFAIATCEDMRQDFRAMVPGATTLTAHCGVDPSLFVPATDGAHNGRLLAIGRLVEQKGYDVLLDAMTALPAGYRPSIDIVGAGELEDWLRNETAMRELGPWLNFLGPRPAAWIRAEGPRYKAYVAPFCLCRNGDRDSSPVSIKEAMAMGLPVLASAVMGIKEMVTPETGRLLPQRDVLALAEGLRWLAAMPDEERGRLGLAGRRRVQNLFTLDVQAGRLSDAIRAAQP